MSLANHLTFWLLLSASLLACLAARWMGGGWANDLQAFALWRADRHETWSRRWLAVRRWARGG